VGWLIDHSSSVI